ncbi:MAG: HEPN domain-containing protein [Chloroflexi bacterium]|nr:HEPN domain-containing protein [Chloroflexota bacterium]
MNALAEEWIAKAEGDWRTANREMRVRRAPNYDAVCFHCQQCAEKYLKALLQKHGHHIPKIHDLNQLLEYCLPYDGTLELHRDLLKDLTRYAVEFRYPGESATKEDARTALHHAKTLRAFLRPKFK